MVKPVYNCSIDDLFLALNYGWELTEQNLPALAAYKSKYTPQYVKTNRADLRSAEDLPDQTAPTGEKSNRLTVKNANNWEKNKPKTVKNARSGERSK